MDRRAHYPVTLPIENPTTSYWHEPLSPLATHRSTETLPQYADTVVVGSGVSGAMIAWNLLERKKAEGQKANIVMLEARTAVGGATGRNGGHTKAASYRTFPHHSSHFSEVEAIKITRLEHANIRATHSFAAGHNIVCESRPCNTVDIIYDATDFAEAKKAIADLVAAVGEDDETGAGKYRVYDQEEAVRKFFVARENKNETLLNKGVKEEVQGAFEYEAGSISAYAFVSGVLGLCVERGLNLQTRTPVTGLKQLGGGDDDGGARWAVETDRGTVRAKTLVLATNGYTVKLLPQLQRLIVPLRGQIQALKPGEGNQLPTPLPTTYSFIYKGGFEYMIPRRLPDSASEQHIVMGGGVCRLPDDGAACFGTCDDSYIDPDVSAYLTDTGTGFYGSNWGENAGKEGVAKEWTGIMGVTPDEVPLVGEVPSSLLAENSVNCAQDPSTGLYLAAGFNGHGMVLCLKSAEALVAVICGDQIPDWFPHPFVLTEKRIETLKKQMFKD